MNLTNLKPNAGSTKKSKRLGRGQGSGRGGTSTKGNKGHQARTGYNKPKGHEGGQMPLQKRIPKFGFTNIFRVAYKPINLYILQQLVENKKITSFGIDEYKANGLISKKSERVKILGTGELKSKIEVKAHAFSASANKAILEKGGKAILL